MNFIGYPEMKKAAEAADKVVAARGAGAGSSSNPCKDDLDMFTLHVLMGVMAGWVTSDMEVYGDRLKKLSEECNVVKRKPVFQHQIIMTTEWWGFAVAGDIEKAVAINWKMIRTNLNALYPEDNEASSNDAAFHIDDVELLNAKVLTFGWLYWVSKNLYTSLDATACFDQNRFGENGDRIVDHFYAYVYEQHHAMAVDIFSLDFQIFGAEPFWLTLQYGRVNDSIKMLARGIVNYKKVAADPQQNGYSYSMLIGCTTMPLIMYMHGQHEMGRKLLEAAGVNFNTAYQRVQDFCSDGVGNVYIAMDEKGDGDGLFSMRKIWWFLRCCLILNGDVSEVEAIEFLQSLPADKEFLAMCGNTKVESIQMCIYF
eukprot:gene5503-15581_t